MLRTFIKDLATMPDKLSGWVVQGDMESALRQLHTLNGVAATLSATALSVSAVSFEKQLAAQPTASDRDAIIRQAGTTINAACVGLATLLRALEAAEAPLVESAGQLDSIAFLAALRKITGQLESADMAATDAMTALQREFGDALGTRLQPMDEAINALDFQRALCLCDELINKLSEGQTA
jgi:HPt (histidine-containing phosphotransfer) domain-containing protein